MSNTTRTMFFNTLKDPAWAETREIAEMIPEAGDAAFGIVAGLVRSSLQHMQAMVDSEAERAKNVARNRAAAYSARFAKSILRIEYRNLLSQVGQADFNTPIGNNGPKRLMFLPPQLLWMANNLSEPDERYGALHIVGCLSEGVVAAFEALACGASVEPGREEEKALLKSHAHAARNVYRQSLKLKADAADMDRKTYGHANSLSQNAPNKPTDWAPRLMKV